MIFCQIPVKMSIYNLLTAVLMLLVGFNEFGHVGKFLLSMNISIQLLSVYFSTCYYFTTRTPPTRKELNYGDEDIPNGAVPEK